MKKGQNNWVFCDGYLSPRGNNPEFERHESLMLTKLYDEKENIELLFIFEDRVPPKTGIFVELAGMRTNCIRLDKPLGGKGFMLRESA